MKKINQINLIFFSLSLSPLKNYCLHRPKRLSCQIVSLRDTCLGRTHAIKLACGDENSTVNKIKTKQIFLSYLINIIGPKTPPCFHVHLNFKIMIT